MASAPGHVPTSQRLVFIWLILYSLVHMQDLGHSIESIKSKDWISSRERQLPVLSGVQPPHKGLYKVH